MKDEDMSVDDYYNKKYGKKNTKKSQKVSKKDKKDKKDTKDKKSTKRKVMDVFIGLIPGGKNIKKATTIRTGSKTMDEKHNP